MKINSILYFTNSKAGIQLGYTQINIVVIVTVRSHNYSGDEDDVNNTKDKSETIFKAKS